MKTRNQMKTEIADLQEKLQEMQEKAIEAHKEQCHNLCKGYICYAKSDVHNGNWNQCDSNCIYIKDFINILNNK